MALTATAFDTTAETTQHMYLTLHASSQAVTKCYSHLNALAAKHGTVPVDLAGVAVADEEFLLTVDVNLGARERIAEPSEEAANGYAFVVDLMETMFEFLPQYCVEPDAEARAAAESFQSAYADLAPARLAI